MWPCSIVNHQAAEDSVHLTVGLDTHIWGLDYFGARRGALARANEADALQVTALPEAERWRLMAVPTHVIQNAVDPV